MPEYPESRRPTHVQALPRPPVLARARQLAFLRFQKPDLARAERFWQDFGLRTVERSDQRLVMRGHGDAPAVLVAEQGPSARYLGSAFEVGPEVDLAALVQAGQGVALAPHDLPGGGEGIALRDPDGHAVWLVRGFQRCDEESAAPPLTDQLNGLHARRRVNSTIRPAIAPASVGRLGHVVLQTTDFATLADWYQRHLGLLATDVQYLPDGSPLLCFFRLDLGDAPADHHTVVIAGGLEARYEHSAWEVADLDALGQGQQVLRAQGHRHLWGIGRHVLGSQLFDYWLDPDGFEFEHYTDGDLFTADRETHYVPFSTGSIWAWGPDAPPSMFPRKTPAMLWRVIRLLRQGRMTLPRLRMLGQLLDLPARPWR